MSYTDDVDLEAQIPYSDSPEFDRLSENIATRLFDINSNIVKVRSLLKSLTQKDDIATEERAVQLVDRTRDSIKETSNLIKQIQVWPDGLPAQKFTQQKLSREFSSALSEFQEVQRDLAERQRSSIIRAKSDLAGATALAEEQDEETGARVQEPREQTALLVNELDQQAVDYQQSLIAEREMEIEGIEHGIEELNEIFRDLGTIVSEQGTIIDNIESNIYSVAESTRDASTQLTKAARYQRNTRGRMFCLLIILAIVLTVVLLGVC
jgi:t-SNARE complex subunit (syntaxin)